MPFGLRIPLLIAAVLALAVGLAAALAVLAAARSSESIARERWSRTADALQAALQRPLALGLPASGLAAQADLLVGLPARDADVVAAWVAGHDGAIVIGNESPAQAGQVAMTRPLTGAFGEAAGMLHLVCSRQRLHDEAFSLARWAAAWAAATWLAATALAAGAGWYLAHRLARQLAEERELLGGEHAAGVKAITELVERSR